MSRPGTTSAAWIVRAVGYAGVAVAVTGAISLRLSGPAMALGIALGALLLLASLALSARAVSELVADPQRHAPEVPGGLALPTVLLLKWPLLLLALGGVLWYLPARPEGVAIGVALSLAASAAAAATRRQGRQA